jgi:hypothetical protein
MVLLLYTHWTPEINKKSEIMKYLEIKWSNVIVYLQHAEDWYLQDLLTRLDM